MAFNMVPRKVTEEQIAEFVSSYTEWGQQKILPSLPFIFGVHVFELIDPEPFRVLYKEGHRPCYPVNIILAAELYCLMTATKMEDLILSSLSDRAIRFALHLFTCQDILKSFSMDAVEEFRIRCDNYYITTGQDLVRDCFIHMVPEMTRILHTNTLEERIDSGFIDANIEKLSRMKILYRCVARLFYALDKLGIAIDDQFRHYLDHNDWNSIDYHDEETPEEEKLKRIIDDGQFLLRIYRDDPEVTLLEDWDLLKRVFSEQLIQEDDGTWRLKKNKSEGLNSQTLQNPTDPDATFRNKAGEDHSGYLAVVAEAGSGPSTVRVYWEYSANITSDPFLLEQYLASLPDNPNPEKLITMTGDGQFSSESAKETAAVKGRQIITTNLSGRKPNEILLKFTFNDSLTEILTCPNGCRPVSCSHNVKNQQIRAHMETEKCKNCPFRENCRPKEQKKDSVVTVTTSSVLRARSWEAMTTDKDYGYWCSYRNGIECVFSLLRRFYRIDTMTVRTYVGTRYVFNCVMRAINAKQLCKYFSPIYKEEVKKALQAD